METIVLLQSQRLDLSTCNYGRETINGRQVTFRESVVVVDPTEFLSNQDGIQGSSIWKRKMNNKSYSFKIQIGVDCTPVAGTARYNGFLRVQDDGTPGILQKLHETYGKGLKLKVDMCKLEATGGYNGYGSLSLNTSREMHVVLLPSTGVYGFEENSIQLNYSTNGSVNGYNINHLVPLWNQRYNFQGNITISATIPKSLTLITIDTSVSDTLIINKKILKEEIGWDVTIIPKNGVNIKCHKNFLFAHSSVFATMFQSSMQESKTNIVEILDMTEASVRALLAYLYYWEVQEAVKCSLVCFELFHAGHKYDISKLEECMKTILLSKENDWYDVDVAMRLFLFSRNLPESNNLKMKAIQVLKSKFSILEKSDSYQELFKKDPKAAMELCKYAFSI